MDMFKMLGKMKDVQAKLKEAQDELVNITASAESGAGIVKTEVNGKRQVIKLDIDNNVIKPEDKEIMQDLVIAAINKALEEVEVKSQEALKEYTQGLLPNIPGMKFE